MLLLRMLLLRIGVDGCERRAAPGCRATRVLGRPRCSEPTSPITASASGTHLAGVHGASTVRKRKRREEKQRSGWRSPTQPPPTSPSPSTASRPWRGTVKGEWGGGRGVGARGGSGDRPPG